MTQGDRPVHVIALERLVHVAYDPLDRDVADGSLEEQFFDGACGYGMQGG